MAIRPVNTDFLKLKLAQSPARALRDLHSRNITVSIYGLKKLSVRDGYDLKTAITRFKKSGICPQLDHRMIARTVREAGAPAVIRALEYRGITDLDAARTFFPEKVWSRDLYAAIQDIMRFTNASTLDEGIKIRHMTTWNSFQEFACSAANPEDRKLVVNTLFDMIELHDWQTALHCRQTRDWAMSIAYSMGLSSKDIRTIGLAAYMHDIGKIGVPKTILNKKGPLNDDELTHIRNLHVTFGSSILKDCGWAEDMLDMIRYHHYIKLYPEGIDPQKAPLGAKILAVADSVEAATAGRVYQTEKSLEKVLKELRDPSPSNLYDQNVVDAFERIIQKPR